MAGVVLLAGCALSPAPKAAGEKAAVETVAPYLCRYASPAPRLTGKMDDPAWSKATTVTLDYTWRPPDEKIRRSDPESRTECKLLYDDKYLYVAFKAYDLDIWSTYRERDEATCREDVLEIFFKPDPDRDPYYNFEVNVLGATLDACNMKRWAAGNYKRWMDWNCEGLKTAITVQGTNNNWRDKDEYWILEAAIPFAELPTLPRSPKKGDTWLFNLARYDYSVYLRQGREMDSFAPLGRFDFHWYEDYVKLIFE